LAFESPPVSTDIPQGAAPVGFLQAQADVKVLAARCLEC
jgi:hypothetical protein